MRPLFALLALCLGLAAAERRPNVMVILVDDMGYSDLGCYGGEIATPNLDGLAARGLRFTQFYNTARCWPSRSALLSGYYAQEIRRDTVPGVKSGAQGTRPEWAKLLPERLRAAGYASYHSGKWHVDGLPLKNGFDRSYSLNDHDRHFAPRQHTLDDQPLPAVAADAGYYSTTATADHALRCLREHAAQRPTQPFFSFVAFIAPHFPLQAPAADIARYKNVYDKGWDALRVARHERQKAFGFPVQALSPLEPEVGPPYAFPNAIKALGPNELNRPLPWAGLTPEQRAFQAAKMSVHAAMVDRVDQEVGRLLAQLKAMSALDDTLILFLSDNGASAEMMVRGDGHDATLPAGADHTFLSLGPGWSSLSNTPFRRHKTWVHEGGISTPLIAHWPKGIAEQGVLRQAPGHLVDIVPTVLELAGAPALGAVAGEPAAPGQSLLPILKAATPVAPRTLWWLHEGNAALRVGDYKLVKAKGEAWALYDLSKDRAEQVDLAAKEPAKLAELAKLWEERKDRYFTEAKAK
jgi:arylsulfatase A-like enzyme